MVHEPVTAEALPQERGRDRRGASAGDETTAHSGPGVPMTHGPVESVARRPTSSPFVRARIHPWIARWVPPGDERPTTHFANIDCGCLTIRRDRHDKSDPWSPLRSFEVVKPLEGEVGTVAPAFGEIGLGTQFRTPDPTRGTSGGWHSAPPSRPVGRWCRGAAPSAPDRPLAVTVLAPPSPRSRPGNRAGSRRPAPWSAAAGCRRTGCRTPR